MSELKKVFKSEESRFMLAVGLKVSGISFAITSFIYYFIYLVIRLNYAFFKANGFPEFTTGETPFFDYIIGEAFENATILFLFHIYLFFIGFYVGWIILRPFRMIGDYCEKVVSNNDEIYKVDEFSTYKLLTRFSEYFFQHLRESRKKGYLTAASVPPQFSKIHKPVLDRVFMLHFGLLLIIIGISNTVFIVENATSIFQSMIDLGQKTLINQKSMNKFFTEQLFIIDEIVDLTILLITAGYLALGFHLYTKVSGAAFGIFSTMRSFAKGNYFSRVHLVGYAYIRENTRKLNKYLDYIQNNFDKEKPKG